MFFFEKKFKMVHSGVSPCGFRAESRTVVGNQAPRVEASLGFYYSGFIQPNKQTREERTPRAYYVS